MNTDVFIPTKGKFEEILQDTFNSILERKFPQLVRQANRKEWLTTTDFEELFGISSRLQKYYRDELGLPYRQESRKILYKTDEVEAWLDERKVNK